jgi:predicted esterase
MTHVHTIEARTHGRYLVSMPTGEGPHPWMIGFHGYGQRAEHQMTVLEAIDAEGRWGKVSVQGLHRFYTRSEDVVASWMTREDRELAIGDNVAYVQAVAAAVRRDAVVGPPLVFVGFSQGVATAYRAAAADLGAAGLIVLAGDVPPDVAAHASRLPPTLIGRGVDDAWYSPDTLAADLDVLRRAGVGVEAVEFKGGHAWEAPMIDAARGFLDRLTGTRSADAPRA